MYDKKEKITLTLPSELKYLDLIHDLTSGVSRATGFNEDTTARVKIAVGEAATNAIIHGNRNDKRKALTLSFYDEGTGLVIKVIDRGRGFALTEIEDPVHPTNFLREGGRGIFIMKQYMDEVSFHFAPGIGTEVKLVKYKKEGKQNAIEN